jgi:parallel beta-helix repeat protein
VTSNVNLTSNLDCSSVPVDSSPILEVVGPASLNLKSFTIIGNGFTDDEGNPFGDTCIEVTGAGAKVWNGSVTQCGHGVVIAGEGGHIIRAITSKANTKIGFKVRENSDGNRLINNQAIGNNEGNVEVEENSDDNRLTNNNAENSDGRGYDILGNNNSLRNNRANGNSKGALRLRTGNNNEVIHNILNGSESGEGIEIRSEGNIVRKNTIKHNERGIRIRENNNKIVKNIIINNGQEGIRVESIENIISKNIIKNNGFIKSDAGAFRDGLKLEKEANENIVTKNDVRKNLGNGINVDLDAINNSIEHNIAKRNGVDNTYFDALDGNLDCDENIWCENHFGTKNPEDCIDSGDCEVGDEDDLGYNDDEGSY